MLRLMGRGLIIFGMVLATSAAAPAKILDGMTLEGSSTLNRGSWNLKSYLEFGSGAEPLTAPVLTGGATSKIQVDVIRLPVEVRFGLYENWEVGGDMAFESDDGTEIPASISATGTTVRYLDGSGLQHMRLFGKWNFFGDAAAMAELAFVGDNELYHGLDGFDFGLKFMYSPQLGAGTLNLNLGLLLKGGDPDLDGNGSSTTGEDYNTVFSYGIGYVYPYADNFAGIFELTGGSSPFKGGGGVTAKGMLGFNLGARYGFSDRFFLDGGLGIGLSDGTPDFLLKVGMDWMWGAVEEYTSTSTPPPSRWKPEGETRESTPQTTRTASAAPQKEQQKMTTPKPQTPEAPIYEQPTRYETPQTQKPAEPDRPSTEMEVKTRVSDAQAAFNAGDFTTAAAHYEAAVKLKENDPVIHYNLATAYFQIKKYESAKTYYKNAIQLNPQDIDSHLYLGYTNYYLGDQQGAIREWQKVLEIDPSNQLARENLRQLGIE